MGYRAILTVLIVGFSGGVFAAEPEFIYEGKNVGRGGGKCQLFVAKTYHAGKTGKWEDLRLEVTSSYKEHGKSHDEVVLAGTKSKELKGTNGEATITVVLEKDEDLDSAKYFALELQHTGHTHSHICRNLKRLVK